MAEGEAAAEDKGWLVDMVVQFMGSSSWNGPLNTFIGEKCILFDNFQEENKLEYMEMHNEYKCLVDDLLTAHLLEVDIMPEDFERQCIEAGLADDPRLEKIIKQLMAVEDYVAFKQMMIDSHMGQQMMAEANFQDVTSAEADAAAAAEAAAVAAALDSAELEAATAEAIARQEAAPTSYATPVSAAVTGGPVPPPPQVVPAVLPSAQQERAFGAGGGHYGRGAMPAGGGKKAATNDKAAAIRKAITSACRPR